MMQQQRLKQQQALMQQSLYHPGLLAPPQIEPILSGNLPPGFDSSTCRSVYVGNIHPQVTELLLQEVFSSAGPLEGCKLIRKDKDVTDIYLSLSKLSDHLAKNREMQIIGLDSLKVNWAYAGTQREDTSTHFNIFVGDLSPEVTDATLFACFSMYPSCSDARVMWDQKTGRSRGFGFVSFRNKLDAQSAINDMNGENASTSCFFLLFLSRKWLGTRQIRCNWATKGAGLGDDQQSSDSKNIVELTNGSSEDGQEKRKEDGPENNPQYTTVYVGNLAPEVSMD
ncbi:UNVERIFIED_CONTAM: Oligouridylate-binding protein 1 [Sesamum radiatum]|uniref:Oligouridylate-binding protein 1 n=1 Tax=Sesamum radiatum TaxID=300843 RepID=A0AAW2NNZ4_SESRA